MTFLAYDLAIGLARQLREPLLAIRRNDSDLARQLARAASSVALNVAEGNARAGADRRNRFRIALGSCREVVAALDVAAAWDYGDVATARAAADRLGGVLYGLVR